MEVLELEKQKLQGQCLRLEAEVLKNEEKLHLLKEEYQTQDAARVQNMEELKAVALHWTEKWQKVALTLQSTQEELKELKKNNSRNKVSKVRKKNPFQLKEGPMWLATEAEKLKKEVERQVDQYIL